MFLMLLHQFGLFVRLPLFLLTLMIPGMEQSISDRVQTGKLYN